MYLKVKDDNQIVRDSRTKAILCVDPSLTKRHKLYERTRNRDEAYEAKINSLEAQIDELRAMIRSLNPREET